MQGESPRRRLIDRAFGPYTVPNKPYPGAPLPDELAPWHCYTIDSGHCIAIVSEDHAAEALDNPASYLVPAPVKAVLRAGYRASPGEPGLLVARLSYSGDLGLEGVLDDDYEFDEGSAGGQTPSGEAGATLAVGRRYPGMAFPVPERGEYNYYRNGHELRIFWASPSEGEIRAVREGEARFALHVHRDIVFFLYRFGDLPWSDAPFSVHLIPKDLAGEIPEPDAPPNLHALLLTVLVDASSGTVHGLRGTTFSPDFTRRLHAAIKRQAERPWPGQAAYEAQLAEAYRRFATSARMAKNATASTKGGA